MPACRLSPVTCQLSPITCRSSRLHVAPIAPVAPVDESRAERHERLGVRRRARLGARPGFVFQTQRRVERLEQDALELGGVQNRVHRRLGSGRVLRERLSE